MFEDVVLSTDLVYPPIVRDGTVVFSKGGAPQTFFVTTLDNDEDFLLFVDEPSGVRVPAYYDFIYNGTNAIYRLSGSLYIFMNDFDTRSGTIYWRVYGDRS